MYFPYIKTRQAEVDAIINTVCHYSDSLVIPIIEPYSDIEEEIYSNRSLLKIISSLIKSKKEFILITEEMEDLELLKQSVGSFEFDKYCIYGLLTPELEEDPFIDLENLPEGIKIAVIHRNQSKHIPKVSKRIYYHIFLPEANGSRSYIRSYEKEKRIKIENAFISEEKNKEYGIENSFSDSCYYFEEDQFGGFGDYLTLTRVFNIPSAVNMNYVTVALHLTYEKEKEIFIRHYTTEPKDEPLFKDRILSTIFKALLDKELFLYSRGIKTLEEKQYTGTNLTTLKRVSLEHHIEVMHNILIRNKR